MKLKSFIKLSIPLLVLLGAFLVLKFEPLLYKQYEVSSSLVSCSLIQGKGQIFGHTGITVKAKDGQTCPEGLSLLLEELIVPGQSSDTTDGFAAVGGIIDGDCTYLKGHRKRNVVTLDASKLFKCPEVFQATTLAKAGVLKPLRTVPIIPLSGTIKCNNLMKGPRTAGEYSVYIITSKKSWDCDIVFEVSSLYDPVEFPFSGVFEQIVTVRGTKGKQCIHLPVSRHRRTNSLFIYVDKQVECHWMQTIERLALKLINVN